MLCEEGEYTIALRQKSMGRLRVNKEDDDSIPSESGVEENKRIPDAPGFNSISKISLEAAPCSMRKANTTPSKMRKKSESSIDELGDCPSTPRTPTMSVNGSRFFEDNEQLSSHRKQICMTKDGYKAVPGKKYTGMNFLKVIK